MNTEQTAQQLRLAATILETGHPYEFCERLDNWLKYDGDVMAHIRHGDKIRLALATPPDGRPLHNPGNLTAEQVGAGYRTTLGAQEWKPDQEYWSTLSKTWKPSFRFCLAATYRLPLSVPWPELKPDPYAELKAAHAAGKVIQILNAQSRFVDADPTWASPPEYYRIKPEATFQLPPPPPGMQWHREDEWKEGDLPQGWRPLVFEEREGEGDEDWSNQDMQWMKCYRPFVQALKYHRKIRTRRPLTFTHAGKQWTWHRVGEPMPCDADKHIHYLMVGDADCTPRSSTSAAYAGELRWNQANLAGDIIGWRYADEKKTVPQPSTFFFPSTAIRFPRGSDHWSVVEALDGVGIVAENKFYSFEELHELKAMANRSIPLTGKWDPNSWEPCHKTVQA